MSILNLAKSKNKVIEHPTGKNSFEAKVALQKPLAYSAKSAKSAKRVDSYKIRTDSYNHDALQAKRIGIIGESQLPKTKGKVILIKFGGGES